MLVHSFLHLFLPFFLRLLLPSFLSSFLSFFLPFFLPFFLSPSLHSLPLCSFLRFSFVFHPSALFPVLPSPSHFPSFRRLSSAPRADPSLGPQDTAARAHAQRTRRRLRVHGMAQGEPRAARWCRGLLVLGVPRPDGEDRLQALRTRRQRDVRMLHEGRYHCQTDSLTSPTSSPTSLSPSSFPSSPTSPTSLSLSLLFHLPQLPQLPQLLSLSLLFHLPQLLHLHLVLSTQPARHTTTLDSTPLRLLPTHARTPLHGSAPHTPCHHLPPTAGKKVLTGSDDGTVKYWNPVNNMCTATFQRGILWLPRTHLRAHPTLISTLMWSFTG